jgi:hypothetical protein
VFEAFQQKGDCILIGRSEIESHRPPIGFAEKTKFFGGNYHERKYHHPTGNTC